MLKDVDSLGKQSHRNLFLLLHFHYPLSILSFSFSSRHFCVSLFFSHLTFFYPLPTAHSLFLYPHHASLNKLSLLLFSHIPHSFSLVPLSLFPCNTLSLSLQCTLSLSLSRPSLSLYLSPHSHVLFHSVLPNSNPLFRPTLTLLSLSRPTLTLSLAHFTLYLVPLLLSGPTLSFYLSPHSHFSFPNPTLFAVLLALLSVSHSTLLSLVHSIFFYRSTLSPVSLFIFISPTLPSHSTRTVGLLVIGKKFKRWRD